VPAGEAVGINEEVKQGPWVGHVSSMDSFYGYSTLFPASVWSGRGLDSNQL
jgi:hypothetical protein